MFNLKRVTGLAIALIMAITFLAQPLVVLADTYGESSVDYYYGENDDYLPYEANGNQQVEQDPLTVARIEFFEILYNAIPEVTRFAYLCEDSREIALYDFDYFARFMLATVPTKHMFERLFGITLENYLDSLRVMIYDMVPVPSFTALSMGGDRWAETPEDTLMVAADYMFTLLLLFVFELGGFGHFIVQELPMIEQMFPLSALMVYYEEYILETLIMEFDEAGLDGERAADALMRFHQVHYERYSTPSVLWFYDIDPAEFDFETILEQIGFMDENNITTYIIEQDRIAYVHIASFMNNMEMDAAVLFPFFEEVQDFEHLIIDLRGNGGGFVGYFPALIVSMLIDEDVSFSYPEFFIMNELNAPLFENPSSMASANLYGIFPAAEFVQNMGMTQFNRDDLSILDYVAVWNVVYSPSEFAIPFGGYIWMLVDEGSASASVMAAKIAVNTGFATVVGVPTSRITGVIYTFVALPNTGVLFRVDLGYTTDQYGRSIEEFGIIPQIPNLSGMDALETVLAIINGDDSQDPAETHAEDDMFRYIDGVPFVRVRYIAYFFGGSVEWDGPNQSVIVTAADGSYFVVAVSYNGVINYDDKVYVPVENIEVVLSGLFV